VCDECKVKEDEYLLEISYFGIVLTVKQLCEDCFQVAIDGDAKEENPSQ
jgi:C4-type Zn-finger protein